MDLGNYDIKNQTYRYKKKNENLFIPNKAQSFKNQLKIKQKERHSQLNPKQSININQIAFDGGMSPTKLINEQAERSMKFL